MNILWLKTELLHPVDKGGKIRTYGMLRELKRFHHVTYLTLDAGSTPEAVERAEEYCHELIRVPHLLQRKFSFSFYAGLLANFASRLPFALRAYRSPRMRRAIEDRVGLGGIDLLICDFLSPSPNVPDGTALPKILFQHNVESMIWRRHFEVQDNVLKKAFLWLEWQRMRSAEERECRRYDRVVAVSEEDAREFEDSYALGEVESVSTGVDTEFFSPSGRVEPNPHEIVFTGSMDWLPNQDAVGFFLEAVFPDLLERVPGVHFTVVGRNPPSSLQERSEKDPHLTVTGFVDDVRPYVERAALFVVPIRVGGGTRLKIFEAMAMGKPVVSTTIGAEGLPLVPGKDIIIADDAASMVREIEGLLSAPEAAAAWGEHSARLVRERFGWDVVSGEFAKICESVVEAHSRGGRGPRRMESHG
jgi:glycosyltransferase involved in cell wall biosynthesis